MLVAAVLAAGASTRMGKNKLALPWGQSTVLETTMQLAGQYPFDKRFVVLGFEHKHWLQKWEQQILSDRLQWEILLNHNYQQGQSTSVVTVARNLSYDFGLRHCEGACFFLGDQPLVQPATIRALAAAWTRDKSKIVIPTYQGKRGNPVIFPAWCFKEMLALKADAGARSLFEKYSEQVLTLAVADRGVAVDLDTPEAYQQESENLRASSASLNIDKTE